MENYLRYKEYRKPTWAPPSWVFAPVWTILYLLIGISFGYVFFLYLNKTLPFIVLLPFLLNLLFNFSYTPIQFRLRNFSLALIDIVLVDITLVWALLSVHTHVPWVVYINLPYLAWVLFATVLQISVTVLNSKRR
ncbi:MAG: tryptophan-rich sensory protein [Parcubacteria bacterium C7867-008]|nr:MAG: tryptophan-rich sensory protein [Parcubacteria bacterium C7867-008]